MSEVNGPAITVLGVGNAVMGDDAAGLEILRLLKARVAGGSGDSPAPVDVDALVPLVTSAYRGDASRAGWTTEADFLDGNRIDPDVLRADIERPQAGVDVDDI